jgi:hypothetical protein
VSARVVAALRELADAIEASEATRTGPVVNPSDFMRETLPAGVGTRIMTVIRPWLSNSACWADVTQFDCRKFIRSRGWGRKCHRVLLEGLQARGLRLACGCGGYIALDPWRCPTRPSP